MSGDSKSTGDAVEFINKSGKGPVVLLCEHASNRIPTDYAGLGLASAHATSHAAWDPGARDLAVLLSNALDAPLVASTVSRLVYDCNRPPSAPSAMPTKSELVNIPGNKGLSLDEKDARVRGVYEPFCTAVSDVIGQRKHHNVQPVVVTIHSFTRSYFGAKRDVDIGILHDSDPRLADLMLAQSPQLPGYKIERNAPYGPEDGVTHSLVLHGVQNGLHNVMIEVCNDLLTGADAVARVAEDLLTLLRPALAELTPGGADA